VEELPALKEELETILEEASRKPADPLIVPEYAGRVRSRFRALHHCFVDTQAEPLLEKLVALCDLGCPSRCDAAKDARISVLNVFATVAFLGTVAFWGRSSPGLSCHRRGEACRR
jgi:hypothetical protein